LYTYYFSINIQSYLCFVHSRIRRRVLHRFYGIANRNIFGGPHGGDATDADGGEAEDPEAQKQAASEYLIHKASLQQVCYKRVLFCSVGLQKKYFKTWQISKDIKPKEPSEKDPIINKEAENELEEVSYYFVRQI
jgi:hypothetical protein